MISVVAKGNRMVGCVLQMLRTRTKEIMLIFKKLFVPQVEHGCIILMLTSQNSVT